MRCDAEIKIIKDLKADGKTGLRRLRIGSQVFIHWSVQFLLTKNGSHLINPMTGGHM